MIRFRNVSNSEESSVVEKDRDIVVETTSDFILQTMKTNDNETSMEDNSKCVDHDPLSNPIIAHKPMETTNMNNDTVHFDVPDLAALTSDVETNDPTQSLTTSILFLLLLLSLLALSPLSN